MLCNIPSKADYLADLAAEQREREGLYIIQITCTCTKHLPSLLGSRPSRGFVYKSQFPKGIEVFGILFLSSFHLFSFVTLQSGNDVRNNFKGNSMMRKPGRRKSWKQKGRGEKRKKEEGRERRTGEGKRKRCDLLCYFSSSSSYCLTWYRCKPLIWINHASYSMSSSRMRELNDKERKMMQKGGEENWKKKRVSSAISVFSTNLFIGLSLCFNGWY